jgi:putative hydrolase of the HAD superfamily
MDNNTNDHESRRSGTISGAESSAKSSALANPTEVAKPVRLIVFDMGHVFVDFDWQVVCQGICNRAGFPRENFKEVLAHVGGLGYENGKISTEGFLAALNEKLGSDITLAEFDGLWNATFVENTEMADLMQHLGKERPLYLLSNTNENHYGFLQRTYNVARHFQELILSYEVGSSKPDRRIYEEVLARSGLTPQECVFIDDLEQNVAAASALGMHAVRFIGIDDLKERLRALGIAC